MRLHGTLTAGNEQSIYCAAPRTIMPMREERQTRFASDRTLSCRTQQFDLVERGKLSPLSQAIDHSKDLDRAHNIEFFSAWGR